MAKDKNGKYIKGTKKDLPEGWVTYGFQYAVLPEGDQPLRLKRAFGSERKVYNEYIAGLYDFLEESQFQGGFINYKVPNYTTITKRFDFLDKSNDAFVYNDAKMRFQAAIRKYNEQFAPKPMQYKKSVRKKVETIGYTPTFRDIKGLPKFHSKKQGKFSYTTNQTNNNIKLMDRDGTCFLIVPKFQEGVRIQLHRPLPPNGIIKKATIRREGDRYLVSLSVDFPFDSCPVKEDVCEDKVLALDYSQKDLYVDSEGNTAAYPRFHKIIEKRQRRLNKSNARKRERAAKDEHGNPIDSKNYQRDLLKLQKTLIKAKNQRKDFLHKKSNQITNDFDCIGVEDLDLSNLAQCLSLGKNLHENGFGMFRHMLQYKCAKKGKHYIVVDRFFPSSKLCSCCGHKKETLKLSERVYVCEFCGSVFDRDYNAALNLKQYILEFLRNFNKTAV